MSEYIRYTNSLCDDELRTRLFRQEIDWICTTAARLSAIAQDSDEEFLDTMIANGLGVAMAIGYALAKKEADANKSNP